MSNVGAPTVPFAIRFADILFAEVLDPNGQNLKVRRVVVLTPDLELAAGYPIVVAGVTGTLPNPLTADLSLQEFREVVRRIWRQRLSRRRRNGDVTWSEFLRLEQRYSLPRARVVHGLRSGVAKS